MKYILILFLFFTAFTVHASTRLSGRCVSVTDGDTLKISVNNREIKIRLDGVDCPEIQQAFGANAKQFTQQWSLGRNLIVYVTGTDRYQRARSAGFSLASAVLITTSFTTAWRGGIANMPQLIQNSKIWKHTPAPNGAACGNSPTPRRRGHGGIAAKSTFHQSPFVKRLRLRSV